MSVYELREDAYKPGIYAYDYRKDTGDAEDALGAPGSNGLSRIDKGRVPVDVVVKAADGGIYEIEVLTVTDRTAGFGRMMVAPNVSNVIEIRQVNPPR